MIGNKKADLTEAYTLPRAMSSSQQRIFKTIAVAAILTALVLLLLPHALHHHGLVFTCFLLLPVFLFDRVNIPYSLCPIEQASKLYLRQAPTLFSRFQRPPPAAPKNFLLS